MAIYSDRVKYTQMATDMAIIGGGFIASGFSGRYIENSIKPGVVSTSSTSDKIIAGVANNAPKLGLYYLFTKVGLSGAAAAAIGSVGYDALIRLTNQGANPYDVRVTLQGKDYRILQQQAQQQALPFSNQPAPVLDRQRKYGAMPNFDNRENWIQPRYGSLPFHGDRNTEIQFRYGFASASTDSTSTGKTFGML